MKPLAFLCALLMVVVTFSSAAVTLARSSPKAHFPVTIVDDHGNRVRITHQPKRIVSLDPRDTETVFALGEEKRLVADGGSAYEDAYGISRSFRYPSEWPSPWGRDYPVRAKKLPHIEGGYSAGTPFNLETLESLHPDLVIGPYAQSQIATYRKIRSLGMKVIILDPSSISGIERDIKVVGAATGSTAHVKVVVSGIQKQLSSVRRQLSRVHSRPRVYYEIDASNPTQPFTAGPGTFIDQAIHLAGGKNVADGVKTCSGPECYPQFSLEALVALDPQVIVLGDAQYGAKPSEVRSRAGWETMSAVRSGKVYPFDDELISRAGPRIAVGVRRLARLVHPEAF